jgi:hypothetical protein
MTRYTMHALLLLALTAGVLHGETVYIDPGSTASGQPDGSRQRPFTSWQQVKFQAGNEYLQKAGTVATSIAEIRPTSKVVLGTYGTAAGQDGYAKIESRSAGLRKYRRGHVVRVQQPRPGSAQRDPPKSLARRG